MDILEENRAKLIKKSGIVLLAGNLILALAKIAVFFCTKSTAILGDAIDTSSDALIAVVTIVISTIISKPSDKEHPWGHGRSESIATILLSFLIFYSGINLIVFSAKKIIYGNFSSQIALSSIVITLISVAVKLVLCLIQFHFAKISGSPMIKAEGQNMKGDIILSAGIFVGLFFARIFKLPVLDPVVAVLIGFWIISNAIGIFKEMNLELMDGNTDNSLYEKLFKAASSVEGVTNPHRARIRKISSRWDIDLDIEVDANMTVHEAHKIADKVEKAVRAEIPEIFDIMIHIEPAGHAKHHAPEQFGLSEKDLK